LDEVRVHPAIAAILKGKCVSRKEGPHTRSSQPVRCIRGTPKWANLCFATPWLCVRKIWYLFLSGTSSHPAASSRPVRGTDQGDRTGIAAERRQEIARSVSSRLNCRDVQSPRRGRHMWLGVATPRLDAPSIACCLGLTPPGYCISPLRGWVAGSRCRLSSGTLSRRAHCPARQAGPTGQLPGTSSHRGGESCRVKDAAARGAARVRAKRTPRVVCLGDYGHFGDWRRGASFSPKSLARWLFRGLDRDGRVALWQTFFAICFFTKISAENFVARERQLGERMKAEG